MDVERLVVRLVADASQYSNVLDAAEARLVAFVTGATAAVSRQAAVLAREFERVSIAFEVMTGNAAEGKKLLQDITNLAIETPFHSDELIKVGKQLKAFGFETQQVIPILENLGEVSAATGTPLNRIVLAFGQIKASGRLMGQELRQLTNANIPILENLAKVMGVAPETVRSKIYRGEVNFPQVVQAFNRMTAAGGIYAGMMDRVNKETVSGRWEAFTETLQVAARNLGLAAFQGLNLKDVLNDLTKYITLNKDEQDGWNARLQEFFRHLRTAAQGVMMVAKQIEEWYERNRELVNSIGRVLAAVLLWNLAWRVVWAGVAALAALRGAFLLALSPARLVAALLVGLAVALNQLEGYDLEWLKGLVNGFREGVVWVSQVVRPLLGVVAGFVAVYVAAQALLTLWGGLVALWGGLVVTWGAAGVALTALASPLGALVLSLTALFMLLETSGALDGHFRGLGDSLMAALRSLRATAEQTFQGIVDAFKAGDLELAASIAFKGLEIGWKTVLAAMHAEWVRFTGGLKSLMADVITGAHLAAISAGSVVEDFLTPETQKGKQDRWGRERAAKRAVLDLSQAESEGFALDTQIRVRQILNNPDLLKARQELDDLTRRAAVSRQISEMVPSYMKYEKPFEGLGADQLYKKVFEPAYMKQSLTLGLDGIVSERLEMGPLQEKVKRDLSNLMDSAKVGGGLGGVMGGLGVGGAQTKQAGMLWDVIGQMRYLRAGLSSADPADREAAQKYAPTVAKSVKALEDFVAALTNSTLKVKDQMAVNFQVSADARTMMDDTEKLIKKGLTPFDTFQKHGDLIEEAHRGLAAANPSLWKAGGGIVPSALLEAARPGGIMSGGVYDVANFHEYDRLRKAVSRNEDSLAPTMYAGSREATDTINKSQMKSVSVQEEVLTTLRVANFLHQENVKYQQDVAKAMLEIKNKKGPVILGSGPKKD